MRIIKSPTVSFGETCRLVQYVKGFPEGAKAPPTPQREILCPPLTNAGHLVYSRLSHKSEIAENRIFRYLVNHPRKNCADF